MKYTVALQQTDEGFSVSCPGCPAAGPGATEHEALKNIQVAIQEYLAAVRESVVDAEVREVDVAVLTCPRFPGVPHLGPCEPYKRPASDRPEASTL